eukprot:SAG31_NODE_2078_length_6499_cov_2.182344_2_plen_583_part_00
MDSLTPRRNLPQVADAHAQLLPSAVTSVPRAGAAADDDDKPMFPTDVPRSAYIKFGLLQMYLLLNILGGYMIQPLLIFAQTKFFNHNHDCVTDEQTQTDGCKLAAGKVSQVLAVTGFMNSILSLVCAPIYGRLSDSIGRRKICMASISPSIIQNLALAAWAITDGRISLWWYYAVGLIPGFSFTMAAAYTADIIPGHHRATFFSWQSAIASLSKMVSAAFAGMFATIQVTAVLAFFIQGLALLWVIVVVPETLPPSERKPFNVKNPREVLDVLNFFKQIKIVGKNSVFRRLALTLLVSSMCSQGLYVLQTVYLRQELEFTKDNNVRYSEIAGAGGFVVQIIVTPLVIQKFGEKNALIFGLAIYMLCVYILISPLMFIDCSKTVHQCSLPCHRLIFLLLLSTSCAQSRYMYLYASETIKSPTGAYINSLIQDISNVNYPAISAIKSTLSAGDEQGQILGALSAIQSLAGGLGPFLFSALFTESLKPHAPITPAAIWYVGVGIMFFALVLAASVPASQSQLRRLRAHQAKIAAAKKAGIEPPPQMATDHDEYSKAGYHAPAGARMCDKLSFGQILKGRGFLDYL